MAIPTDNYKTTSVSYGKKDDVNPPDPVGGTPGQAEPASAQVVFRGSVFVDPVTNATKQRVRSFGDVNAQGVMVERTVLVETPELPLAASSITFAASASFAASAGHLSALLGISGGGTGASTLASAQAALGIGDANDASTLQGKLPSVSSVASTIMCRDANGNVVMNDTSLIVDENGNGLIQFGVAASPLASAINYIQIINSGSTLTSNASGVGPVIAAQGDDTNINVIVRPKGATGSFKVVDASSNRIILDAQGSTNPDSYLQTQADNVDPGLIMVDLGQNQNKGMRFTTSAGSAFEASFKFDRQGRTGDMFRIKSASGLQAINTLVVRPGASTLHPSLTASGADTDVNLELHAQGIGTVDIATGDLTLTGSGQILTPNACRALPAYSFSGDPDTGMFLFNTGVISFSASTIEQMRVGSSQILILDGSAAIPGLAFISDPDTGMFQGAANRLGFAAGASGLLFVTQGSGVTAAAPMIAQVGLDLSGGDLTLTGSGQVVATRFTAAGPGYTFAGVTASTGISGNTGGSGIVFTADGNTALQLLAVGGETLAYIAAGETVLAGGNVQLALNATNTGFFSRSVLSIGIQLGSASTDVVALFSTSATGIPTIRPIADLNGDLGHGSFRWNAVHASQFIGQVASAQFATSATNAASAIFATTASSATNSASADNATTLGGHTFASTATADTIALRDNTGNLTAVLFEGEATSAQYADLAERYEADSVYEPGTVMIFGGECEITPCISNGDTRVAGVISTKPGFRMNAQAGADSTHPFLALRGRVPCKVVGRVYKGALLTTSDVPGHAVRAFSGTPHWAVFAKALEAHDDGQGIIEVVVL